MKTTRNFWPLGVTLAFVVFFGGMTAAVVIAATHRDNLVSPNYYEQELKFQGQIDGAARAGKAGANIRHEAADGRIVITVPAAQLAEKFSGTVELYRASASDQDRAIKLQPKADGTQIVDVSGLASGSWIVRVKWNAGDENYFLEQKIGITGQ